MASSRLQAVLLGLVLLLGLGLALDAGASLPNPEGVTASLPNLAASELISAAGDDSSLSETRVRGFRLFDPLSRPGWNGVSRGNATRSTFGLWGIRVRPVQKGLWTDPVTGNAYARARWYDARNGVFLTEDPMGDVDSPNLYAFVGWGPSMYTDPLGLCFGGLKCRDLGTVWWEFNKANTRDTFEIGKGVLDFATLGFVSGGAEGVQTFSASEGTLLERGQAAQQAMQRRQLSVISLGFSEAEDPLQHASELVGIAGIQRGGAMMGEGIGMGDADLFWRGVGETSGGVGNFAGTLAAAGGGGGAVSSSRQGAARSAQQSTMRQRVLANVADSQAARRSSGFAAHAERTAVVKTPHGTALQDASSAGLSLRRQVAEGGEIFRGGNYPRSLGPEGQYWAFESPLTPGYAERTGAATLGARPPDFMMSGQLKEGANFIVRRAPAYGANAGGAWEVVVESGGVRINYFVSP